MVDLIGRALRSFKNLVVVATETAIRHSGFRINGWKRKLGKRWTRISNQCNATVKFRVRKMGWEAKKKKGVERERERNPCSLITSALQGKILIQKFTSVEMSNHEEILAI